MPYKLSPSSINLMVECPRCFWLAQHKIWKRPAGIFPSLPSGMDRILKAHFDKFRDENKLPPELYENEGFKNIKLFDEENLLETWRNNFKGISFSDEKGNELHGAVDNILVNKDNEKLIVLDYKTRGYPLKVDTPKHYQLQIDIYNYLLRKNDFETEDYSYLLFYIPKEVTKTGEVIFDTKLVKVEVNVLNAENTWKKALKILGEKCLETRCDWCEFVENK